MRGQGRGRCRGFGSRSSDSIVPFQSRGKGDGLRNTGAVMGTPFLLWTGEVCCGRDVEMR